MLVAAAFISLPVALAAQTENPRGIYKMTTLTGRIGEMRAPFGLYKICTDSVTLQVVAQGAVFRISDIDHRALNYTGEQPKTEGDRSTLVYESDARGFKLKWWSDYPNHPFYPKDDWCIEKYEAGQYTEKDRVFFNALTGTAAVEGNNPLTGTWRVIGYVDELHDVKKELPQLHGQYPKSKYFNSFIVLAPGSCTMVTKTGGNVGEVSYHGKKSFRIGNVVKQVKWLSRDRIAVEERIDYRTDWMILERVTDGSSPLHHIAGQYVEKR